MKKFLRKYIAAIYKFFEEQTRQSRIDFLVQNGWLVMGKHTYGEPIVHLYKGSESKVIIGNYSSISPRVTFITGGIHPTNWISTYPFRARWQLDGAFEDGMPTTKGDIYVGSDVWIGTGAIILSGAYVGHGAIIAARSVVSEDIPPYAIVAGVPAKVIRYRFDQDVIRQLLEIQWWNWSDEKIKESISWLSSPNIVNFLAIHSQNRA